MKTMKLALAFITCLFVFGTSITSASYTSYTVDGSTTVSDAQKAYIAESIRQKIADLNSRNASATNSYVADNNNYYPTNTNYPSNATNYDTTVVDDNNGGYYTVNGTYNPSLHYVILQPNGTIPRRNISYTLQRDRDLNGSNYFNGSRIPYIDVESKYNVDGSNLSAEINRFIINKEKGYTLQEQVNLNSYYNYFFTYSNNDYNKRYISNTTDLRSYIEDLVEQDRQKLDYLEEEVDRDIALIRNAFRSYGSYGSNIKLDSYDRNLLDNILSKLKKVKRQINEDRQTLKYVLRNY